MFTGLVARIGTVTGVRSGGASSAIEIDLAGLADRVAVGDSVLIDGACLTVTGIDGQRARFDVSAETLRLTTLGSLKLRDPVNVELAMRPTDRFGGHFVSGHVDGVGTVTEHVALSGETRIRVRVGVELAGQMVMKGSVAVDGVSLTIAGLQRDSFEVSLIPHTLAATTLAGKRAGARVNIECDMIGKWVARLMGSAEAQGGPSPGLTLERLEEGGF